jgi:hypothetical protein
MVKKPGGFVQAILAGLLALQLNAVVIHSEDDIYLRQSGQTTIVDSEIKAASLKELPIPKTVPEDKNPVYESYIFGVDPAKNSLEQPNDKKFGLEHFVDNKNSAFQTTTESLISASKAPVHSSEKNHSLEDVFENKNPAKENIVQKQAVGSSMTQPADGCKKAKIKSGDNYKAIPIKEIQTAAHIKTVPVIMYHEIGDESEYGTRFTVTPQMLRSHLNYLYKSGFVSISLEEFLTDDFSKVPSGKKPVILTFDDSTEGQFRYLRSKDHSLVVDKDCAVGIIEDFSKNHPTFRAKAVFFIDFVDKNGYFEVPFSQPELEAEKISYLLKSGFDVECHTVFHPFLNKDSYKTMFNNISMYKYVMDAIIKTMNNNVKERKYNTIAYPYGDVPTGNQKSSFLSKNFDFCFGAYGNQYGSLAYRVNSGKFLRHNIPRIEINNDFVNLRKYVVSGS